jgi:hypothetical protein
VPLLTVTKGQPRSLMPPFTEDPAVKLPERRTMIPVRRFQIGQAGSIPVVRAMHTSLVAPQELAP